MDKSKAFAEGRSKKDPAEFWYKGEIGFFEFLHVRFATPSQQLVDDCSLANMFLTIVSFPQHSSCTQVQRLWCLWSF